MASEFTLKLRAIKPEPVYLPSSMIESYKGYCVPGTDRAARRNKKFKRGKYRGKD